MPPAWVQGRVTPPFSRLTARCGLGGSIPLANWDTERWWSAPQQTLMSNATAIAAGYEHSLALKSDGTLWAFGSDSYGQLGDGSMGEATSPVITSSALTNATQVAGRGSGSLGLKPDGTV